MPRLPEFLFRIINPSMTALLRSPVHGLMSASVLLLTFMGRNSGKTFTTPLRYIRSDRVLRCFTARRNQWWRNLREEAQVEVRVAGQDLVGRAKATWTESDEVRPHLLALLAEYPGDAPYYELSLQNDGTPRPEELERALEDTVMVEIETGNSGKRP